MAAGNDMRSDGDGEITAHVKSYSAFTQMMKWGTIASFIAAMAVVLIIA